MIPSSRAHSCLRRPLSSSFQPRQEAWEDFSVRHQEWANPTADSHGHDELTTSRRRFLHSDQEEGNSTIPTRIFTRDLEYDPSHSKEYRRREEGEGPYLPLWQMYPIPVFSHENRDLSPVNYNALSHPSIARAVEAMQKEQEQQSSHQHEAILTEPFHLFELFGMHWQYSASDEESNTEQVEPHSVILSPVYKDFTSSLGGDTMSTDADGEVVGMVLKVVPWTSFFQKLVPEDQDGIVLVLEALTCGDTFTIEINGQEAVFLGNGDLHDPDQSK